MKFSLGSTGFLYLNLLCLISFETAMAGELPGISCYNDESIEIINQDELPPPKLGKFPETPAPRDCHLGIKVVGNSDGDIMVDGTEAYDGWSDPALEARVSPLGFVAILTESGSLWKYRTTATGSGEVNRWFEAASTQVHQFHMSRNGDILAIGRDLHLIRSQQDQLSKTVFSLVASRDGVVAALLEDGSIWTASTCLYEPWADRAIALKASPRGVFFWLTASGKVGSSRPHQSWIYDRTTDPAVSFKVATTGEVAFLTRDGRLWRETTALTAGMTTRISTYRIYTNGSVIATDVSGKSHFFGTGPKN